MFVVLVAWGTRGSGATLGRGRLLPGRGFRLGIVRVEGVLFLVVSTCDACAALRAGAKKPTSALEIHVAAANCPYTQAAGNSKLLWALGELFFAR